MSKDDDTKIIPLAERESVIRTRYALDSAKGLIRVFINLPADMTIQIKGHALDKNGRIKGAGLIVPLTCRKNVWECIVEYPMRDTANIFGNKKEKP